MRETCFIVFLDLVSGVNVEFAICERRWVAVHEVLCHGLLWEVSVAQLPQTRQCVSATSRTRKNAPGIPHSVLDTHLPPCIKSSGRLAATAAASSVAKVFRKMTSSFRQVLTMQVSFACIVNHSNCCRSRLRSCHLTRCTRWMTFLGVALRWSIAGVRRF